MKDVLVISCLFLAIFHVSYGEIGYFWHVTDFHYDFTYSDRQLSCNSYNKPSSPGKFGDFWCDSPWSLVNNSIHFMSDMKKDVDFLLWTGDTVLHTGDDNLNYTINDGILTDVTDSLKQAFTPKPVYASFGNHDYWPNNQFPPENNLLYNDTWTRWRHWINDETQKSDFLKGAYYTVKTAYGLRIVVLNTNLYYTSNKAVISVDDPGQQFVWLNKTLSDAMGRQEKVLLTAHIPPGVHTPNGLLWMYEQYNDRLVGILRQYADIIVGMHFGHDHSDGFKLLNNNDGKPTAPIFIAPSVTPWRYVIPSQTGPAHNPGVRLVKYDRQTGQHLDILQYYLDLESANKNGKASWQLEYNTSTAYGLNALTGPKLQELTEKMKQSTGNEFKQYWQFYTVNLPAHLADECDETCHASIVCGFTEFKMNEFTSCKSNMISGAFSTLANGACMTIYMMILNSIFYYF